MIKIEIGDNLKSCFMALLDASKPFLTNEDKTYNFVNKLCAVLMQIVDVGIEKGDKE